VRKLKIIGGEPFMDQEKFINLMERLDLSQITLRVSTNGTVLPNARLKSLIDKCERVIIEVSIDGIGSVGEWYRWPTKFEEVKQVMNQFQDWWGNDSRFEFGTHTVINVFNIWNLDSIVHFMNDNYPTWELYFDWMYNPGWQAICIIPEEFKSEIKANLLKWNSTVTGNWGAHTNSPFLATVDRLNDTPKSNWETFKERTFNLANERNLDVLKMVPELAKILKST
jgi:sulfatase maturation enzyme AslB (radical SAM superfamily)